MTQGPWRYVAPEAPIGLVPREAPTFAVLIAAYNAGPFLAECLDSVLAQTHSATEIIVCDDGSTDDTARVLADYAGQVIVIGQANQGEGAAKNAALAAASSEFVAFLDADDRFEPTRLEAVAWLAAQRPDLDVIATDVHEFGPAARDFHSIAADFDVRDQRGTLLWANLLPVFVARRSTLESVGGFATEASAHRDWITAVRLVLAGARAGIVAEALYGYRRWLGQDTAARAEYYRRRLRTVALFRDEFALSASELERIRTVEHETIERLWNAEREAGRPSWSASVAVARHGRGWRLRARALAVLADISMRRAFASITVWWRRA